MVSFFHLHFIVVFVLILTPAPRLTFSTKKESFTVQCIAMCTRMNTFYVQKSVQKMHIPYI